MASVLAGSASSLSPSLAALLDARALRSVYQPIVDLYDGGVVGYEALARGPAGASLEAPARLFEAASRTGLGAEVEWECQRAALEGALDAPLACGHALFVNFDSELLAATRPAHVEALLDRALDAFPVFVELPERSLLAAPAEVLAHAQALRELGVGIALDDVGGDPASLALIPFLAPDVVKLDVALLDGAAGGARAEIVHAIGAEAERTGAAIVAERVETDAHLRAALALGARYGQGWLFARPQALEDVGPTPEARLATPRRPPADRHASPFEIVARHRPVQRADKRRLLALSRRLEADAAAVTGAGVVLSSFQDARHFDTASAAIYAQLARGCSLVGALAAEIAAEPAPGVHGGSLGPVDPVRSEWNVTLVGPHSAMAFVALDLGDTGADAQRRFDFAITYDRELTIAAAHALMSRLVAA